MAKKYPRYPSSNLPPPILRKLLRPCSTYSKLSTDYLVSAQQRTAQMCALNNLFIWFSFPVLFVSVLVFCATAFWVLSDNRRRLIQSVRLYQPSFLYAYLALLMQGGVIQVCQIVFETVLPTIRYNWFLKITLQALGCIAALKLSERLLNIYWISLLVLLIGDIFVGGMWMIRFDSLTENLSEDLYSKLR